MFSYVGFKVLVESSFCLELEMACGDSFVGLSRLGPGDAFDESFILACTHVFLFDFRVKHRWTK